jgi:hypothetical protein
MFSFEHICQSHDISSILHPSLIHMYNIHFFGGGGGAGLGKKV